MSIARVGSKKPVEVRRLVGGGAAIATFESIGEAKRWLNEEHGRGTTVSAWKSDGQGGWVGGPGNDFWIKPVKP